MSTYRQAARPLAQCLRNDASSKAASSATTSLTMRSSFTTTSASSAQAYKVNRERPDGTPDAVELNPDTAVAPWAEKELWKSGTPPVGSRRRRYAIRTSQNIPFEQLPYQAFQEARKYLAADREEKLAAIREEMDKMRYFAEADASIFKGGEAKRAMKLESLRRYVEKLKIEADINDPAVKRRFEDGLGDMNKPIYRFLARRRWDAYGHKILRQRIDQFKIVPDILPKLDPKYDVELHFRRSKIPMGKLLSSQLTETPPKLRIQPFDAGERLVTIVIMDPDVPDTETDSFRKRCHFIAANVPISPTQTSVPLARLPQAEHVAVPYLPAFAQKGSPYHRLAIFVLDQPEGKKLDLDTLRKLYHTGPEGAAAHANASTPPADQGQHKVQEQHRLDHNFSLKSIKDKFNLTPTGFSIFRTQWDEFTADVMARAGVKGADVEFRNVRIHSMKPVKAARGWEARRQGPKYRSLWKYTKRIRGFSNAKGLVVKKRSDGRGARG